MKDLTVVLQNRPGKLADAGVNVDFAYATFDGCRVVLGVGDPQGAQAALQ
jgi:hypothetical protein